MTIGPPNFWSENSESAVFGRPLHGNEEEFCGKTKTGITTISGLP